jgi:hypothetical protein
MRRTVVPFIACICLWPIAPAHAQQKPQPQQQQQQKPAAAAQRTPTQAAAAMVAAGKYEDALAEITKTLAMKPTDREAVMVKMDALVGLGKAPDALDSYYAFIAAAREQQDAGLARHLAVASLRHAAAGDHPDAQPAAAELLRAAGENVAASKQTPAATTKGAAQPRPEEILANASSSVQAKRMALDRLTAPVSQQTQELVRASLKAGDQWVRLDAAHAAKRLDLRSAIPELTLALQEPQFFPLKLAAAATLREWGQKTGDEVLHSALKEQFLAGRIAAARVLKATGDTSWPPQIVPVLDSPRANERVAAAELLLSMPAHAAKAREILRTEMRGSEVPLRREAIRALTSQADADPWNSLLLMRDADPVVRVYAAGVLMRKLAPAAAPAAAGRSPR